MEDKKSIVENKLEHPCFPQPTIPETKVWRYMDLSKLIDLLSRGELFLCRLDLLGDPHEGSITKPTFFDRQVFLDKIAAPGATPRIIELNQRNRMTTFVSCWYFDNFESEAMWRLYCSDNRGGAIQSTYSKLAQSLSSDPFLYIGLVNYIDYETEWFPSNNAYYAPMHKRKAFRHESEVRIMKHKPEKLLPPTEPDPDGIYIKWDFNPVAPTEKGPIAYATDLF
jgi:hypothetical protein